MVSRSAHPDRTTPAPITWLFLVAAFIGLAVLSFFAHSAPYFPVDLAAAQSLQSIHNQAFDLLMRSASAPGYPPQVYALIALILIVLFLLGQRWAAVAELFANFGIAAVGYAIKFVIDRPRPDPNLIHVVNPGLDGGKWSYPAGHVESYVAVFGFLIFLALTQLPRSWLRTLVVAILGAVIILIGPSRIYMGEHWASDVLAGYLLGSLWLAATIAFYHWGRARGWLSTGQPPSSSSRSS